MSSWAIVAIIAIVMSGLVRIYTSRSDSERGVIRDNEGNPVSPPRHDDAAARREIEELRERIKVLERIATDNNTVSASETRRISQEIEALRDRQDG
jgi:hypothetical protein